MIRLGARCRVLGAAKLVVAASLLAVSGGCSHGVPAPKSVPAALSGSISREFAANAREAGPGGDYHVGSGRAVERTPRREPAARLSQSPIGRHALQVASEEDYTVRIVAPGTSCSGALISDRLVLTAHHCVAVRDREGRIESRDMSPSLLSVELGSGHFPWAEVEVSAIVAPSCGYQAGAGDLALLVLARRMRGVQTITPNLDREPQLGDEVSHLGFGRCALSEDGIYLKRRASGTVDQVSGLGFRVNAPLCPGDSGGPVIDQKSGALIGVVSAGAMDGDERTPDRVQFARLDAFRGLFANASRLLAGTASSELPPVDCPAVQETLRDRDGKTKTRSGALR